MAIKFNCPHCNKAFNVKDQLAGKRAGCPACKKVLTVPAPGSKPADLEAFAAAALAEQPVTAPPQKEPEFIEFVCSYCDSRVQVAADLAGKQTSCPECRRIVKVPLPQKQGPKDWRQIDKRVPSGARRDLEPAPEGAWDARAVGAVSREALLEADAVPQVKPRRTLKQWTRIGVASGALLVVVTILVMFVLNSRAQSLQQRLLARALEGIDADKNPETAAELFRAAGDYHLHAKTPNVEEAHTQFESARQAAIRVPLDRHSNERECLLTDLLMAQAELGGEKAEVDDGKRLKWDKAQNDLRQTLKDLRVPEARAEALRLITRKLQAEGQAMRARPWAAQFQEQAPELLSVLGLELLQGGHDPADVTALAEQASQPFLPAPASKPAPAPKPGQEKKKIPVPPSSLIALWVTLGKGDRAQTLVEAQAPGKPLEPAVVAGFVEGLARQGNWDRANEEMRKAALPDPLAALVAIAAVAVDSRDPGRAKSVLEQAFPAAMNNSRLHEISPWLLYRLVRLGAEVDMEGEALTLAKQIADPDLRGRAQLAIVRSRLDKSKQVVDDSALQLVDKSTPAHGLALEVWARHNARYGGASVQKSVDGWVEMERRFGYIGMVKGLQDAAR